MIKFGTDGWRGIISEDYTFNNVRLVAEGIANYVNGRGEAGKGSVVGYDARFLSAEYAAACAAVLASKGVKVWLADSILPTPALSWQVKDYAAAGGVMITASHNPGEYNGLKFKASYGGSASPEIIVEIEECIRLLEASGRTFSNVAMSSAVEYFAPRASYLEHVKAMLNQKTMAGFKEKIVFDVMYGAAMGYPSELAKSYGLDMVEVHSEFNPSFGGINLEPIEKNLAALRRQPLHQSPSDYGPPDKIFCRETRMVRRRRADADGIRTGEADGTKVRPETLRNTGWL